MTRNISHELDDELMKAGWSSLSGGFGSCDECGTSLPTLPELIEACPKESRDGTNPSAKFNLTWNGATWVACMHYYDDHADPIGTGATPEEAVARLWLELNR